MSYFDPRYLPEDTSYEFIEEIRERHYQQEKEEGDETIFFTTFTRPDFRLAEKRSKEKEPKHDDTGHTSAL